MYFKELDERFDNFLQIVDYKSIFSSTSKDVHKFILYPTDRVLTAQGFSWFKEKGFTLRNKVKIFKILPNCSGPIHVDAFENLGTKFAFNFVCSGHGEMQWVDNIDGDSYLINYNGECYPGIKNIRSFNIVERWPGASALVKTDSFHRVITTSEERYCISIRTVTGSFPKTFEEAVKIIEIN
jgi:hypothetical protein